MSTPIKGWANYETWLVKQGTHEQLREMGKEVLTREVLAFPENALIMRKNWLADEIKDWVEELTEVATIWPNVGLARDLFNSALSKVDWYEIASNVIDEITAESEVTA